MSRKVTLVANNATKLTKEVTDYIGIDKGALFLAKNNIQMILAVGDFDSINEEEKKLVHQMSDEVQVHNPIKDASDSQLAIESCIEKGYTEATFIGALGKRIDHHYVNQQLCIQSPIQLTLLDEKNKMFMLNEGEHVIHKEGYTYLSLFATEDSILSVKGVVYPLDNYELDTKNLIGLSNEISDSECLITVVKGRILCMQTND